MQSSVSQQASIGWRGAPALLCVCATKSKLGAWCFAGSHLLGLEEEREPRARSELLRKQKGQAKHRKQQGGVAAC